MAFLTSLLAACGGGGGDGSGGGSGGSESMSLSSTSVSVSASTVDPAPPAQVTATIKNALLTASYFVAASTTNNGIANVAVSSGSSPVAATANVTIIFKSPGSLGVGQYSDSIKIVACYDQACSRPLNGSPQQVAVQYTVTNPVPTVTTLAPASASAGSAAFALTVYGTEFTASSVVNWNGAPRPTTYVSGTQLTAQIGAADVAKSGAVPVTVTDTGSANSAEISFTVSPLALTAVSPTFIAAGGPTFTLDIYGSGFASSSVARWNGAARTTTFVSATQLQAQIAPADIATAGPASITVVTPSASDGPTAALPVTIGTLATWPAAAHAVAYQDNAAHTGSVTFSSVSFPSMSTWSVDLGATTSYALVANGKVFVTATSSTGSMLYALDQTTGGTVWGGIAIAGVTGIAYDNGVVFVSSGVGGGAPTAGSVQAYDATTGTLLWNTAMSGFDATSTSAPTAANGYVYVTGGQSDALNTGTFGLNESTGAITWLTRDPTAGNSSPAVGASGVYVDLVCGAYALDPATGHQLWAGPPRCSSGGGGTTPFLVGGSLFTPDMSVGGYYSGSILTAATGVAAGTFSAAAPPVFDAQTAYLAPQDQFGLPGMLQAVALGTNTVKWSFAGEPNACMSTVVSQYVVVVGCDGNLYALDAATGQQVWTTTVTGFSGNFTGRLPLPAAAAGDGVLVIPAGTRVFAYTLSMSP